MNLREHSIAEKYKAEGWKVLHKGAPDFLLLKVQDQQISEIMAIEVKSPTDKLSYDQKVWRDVLRKAGVNYKVEVVE